MLFPLLHLLFLPMLSLPIAYDHLTYYIFIYCWTSTAPSPRAWAPWRQTLVFTSCNPSNWNSVKPIVGLIKMWSLKQPLHNDFLWGCHVWAIFLYASSFPPIFLCYQPMTLNVSVPSPTLQRISGKTLLSSNSLLYLSGKRFRVKTDQEHTVACPLSKARATLSRSRLWEC